MAKLSKADFKTQVVASAKAIHDTTDFPWQLIAAQACLETGYGQSIPTDINTGKYSFNVFGIKGEGPAGSVTCTTSEFLPEAKAKELADKGLATLTNVRSGGLVKVFIKDKFKAFRSFEESLNGYISIMKLPRYAPVWEHKDDPCQAAKETQICGYATDPGYANKLIGIMRGENWV